MIIWINNMKLNKSPSIQIKPEITCNLISNNEKEKKKEKKWKKKTLFKSKQRAVRSSEARLLHDIQSAVNIVIRKTFTVLVLVLVGCMGIMFRWQGYSLQKQEIQLVSQIYMCWITNGDFLYTTGKHS